VNRRTNYSSNSNQYRVRTTSLLGNLILLGYLTRFPLFSSKFLYFSDFAIVLNLIVSKLHYASFDRIAFIKSGMNNRRTVFNWDHLANFYRYTSKPPPLFDFM
jgi:hypothetical protein